MAMEETESQDEAAIPTEFLLPQRGVRPADVRAANRACVLASLAHDGPASRVALACRTGLSRVTIGAIVSDLLQEGLLREEGSVPPSAAGGRKATLLWRNEPQICTSPGTVKGTRRELD
jgi:hypothetical protein